jgi:hypothetical protein
MQHRQHERDPNASAEQYDWLFCRLENEAPARRANVESPANMDVLPQIISSSSIRLDLDANSIVFC